LPPSPSPSSSPATHVAVAIAKPLPLPHSPSSSPLRRCSPATLVTVTIAISSLALFFAALIIRRALSLFVVACRRRQAAADVALSRCRHRSSLCAAATVLPSSRRALRCRHRHRR
jgi:hypothetical protein